MLLLPGWLEMVIESLFGKSQSRKFPKSLTLLRIKYFFFQRKGETKVTTVEASAASEEESPLLSLVALLTTVSGNVLSSTYHDPPSLSSPYLVHLPAVPLTDAHCLHRPCARWSPDMGDGGRLKFPLTNGVMGCYSKAFVVLSPLLQDSFCVLCSF